MRARTGIGRYTASLAGALAGPGCGLRLFGVFHKGNRREVRKAPAGAKLVAWPVPSRLMDLLGVMGILTADRAVGGCDVFHHTNYTRAKVGGLTPQVMTIHDLAFLHGAGYHSPRATAALTRVVSNARHDCAAFLVPSEATARDCRERLGIEAQRIHVTPLGVDSSWYEKVEPERSARPYLLAVGTLEPRKNHSRLIRAYRTAFNGSGDAPALRIAGLRGWLCDDVLAEAAATPDVSLLGHVSDERLRRLVAGAVAVLYPSLLEGFGLPVLEAMAAGRPVLTSESEPLCSLAGGQALLVDPGDETAIADGLRRIVEDGELRARLERGGPARAREFSWTACALATLRCYRAVAS